MPSWLPSYPYHSTSKGYWAPVTSTLNWCEEDYYATPYAAEIVNTFTNFLFVYLAYRGIASCTHNGHDTIFVVAFVGYLLVGIGSFLFHATLKSMCEAIDPMQLIDELSMIYTTCLMCYAVFSYSKSRQFSVFLAIGLVSLSVFITLYYHYLQDPAFHQAVYALLTVVMLCRSMYVMEFSLRPSLKSSEEQYKLQRKRSMTPNEKAVSRLEDRRDEKILRMMWSIIACGLLTFLSGFAIWQIDNTYCSTLRSWRREVGLPWGIVLEGHGWWHLMTGTGAYFWITWGIWLRHCLNGRQAEYDLAWPRLFSLPEIVRADNGEDTIGHSNVSKKTL